MLLLAALSAQLSAANACSELPPSLQVDEHPPGAGEMIWLIADRADTDFDVQVNGSSAIGGVVTHAANGLAFVGFDPVAPLAEGDSVTVTVDPLWAYDDNGQPADPVTVAVGPQRPMPPHDATVDFALFGEFVPEEYNSCGFFDAFQRVDVDVSWGPSDAPVRMVLRHVEQDSAVVAFEGELAGGQRTLTFGLPPGLNSACFVVEQIGPDGSTTESDGLCADNPEPTIPGDDASTNMPSDAFDEADMGPLGCGCSHGGAPSALGGLAAVALLTVRRRR